MTIQFSHPHQIAPGDTCVSLVRNYRLSSWRAIRELAANAHLQLPERGALPEGVVIAIPPNARDVLRERLNALHQLHTVVRTHFDHQQSALGPLLGALAEFGSDDPRTHAQLDVLAAELLLDIERLGTAAWPLASAGVAMNQTHIGTHTDAQAAGTMQDPLCGLYWAITPAILDLWQALWNIGSWQARWQGTSEDPHDLVHRYHTTVRSLVLQQIDRCIRSSQDDDRKLLAEGSAESIQESW